MPNSTITCPHCSAGLAVATAPRPGSRFRCPACSTAFTAGPPQRMAGRAPVPDAPAEAPRSYAWLLLVGAVAAGVLLLLTAGVGLAVFLAMRGGPPRADVHSPKDGPGDPGRPPIDVPGPPDRPPIDLPPADAPPANQSVLPPDQQDKVNAAIDKGVGYLKDKQK